MKNFNSQNMRARNPAPRQTRCKHFDSLSSIYASKYLLDSILVLLYYGTMNYVTTNLRFPKDEYEDLKNIAFLQKRSIASLIRDAVRNYRKTRYNTRSQKMKLYHLMAKSRIKIKTSTLELVKMGRKFE